MIRLLRSLPAAILIIVAFELVPIPCMCLDYIRIILQSGRILKTFGVFIMMVFVGIVLFSMASIGVTLLIGIWDDYFEGEEEQ